MLLEQSRIDIILDGISPFTCTSNPPLLAVIPLLHESLKPGRLNCDIEKELSIFVSLIARKSTYVHTNSDKASSLFLTELTLIYDGQTFLHVLVESLLNYFLSSQQQHLFCVQGILEFALYSLAITLLKQSILESVYQLIF